MLLRRPSLQLCSAVEALGVCLLQLLVCTEDVESVRKCSCSRQIRGCKCPATCNRNRSEPFGIVRKCFLGLIFRADDTKILKRKHGNHAEITCCARGSSWHNATASRLCPNICIRWMLVGQTAVYTCTCIRQLISEARYRSVASISQNIVGSTCACYDTSCRFIIGLCGIRPCSCMKRSFTFKATSQK